MRGMPRLLLIAALLGPGCAYRIGSGAIAGAIDELGGEGRTEGVEAVTEDLIERALLVELGHQLGEGLSTGATTVTPEQQAALERTIDSLLTVAGKRGGKGLRNEVSPELRNLVVREGKKKPHGPPAKDSRVQKTVRRYYDDVRKQYPEKGKEYAARVAWRGVAGAVGHQIATLGPARGVLQLVHHPRGFEVSIGLDEGCACTVCDQDPGGFVHWLAFSLRTTSATVLSNGHAT